METGRCDSDLLALSKEFSLGILIGVFSPEDSHLKVLRDRSFGVLPVKEALHAFLPHYMR